MEARLESLSAEHHIVRRPLESPMFLTSRDAFAQYRDGHKRLFMADFYRWQRKRMEIMIDSEGGPVGGNYLRKMSDYPKGEWCDVVDGLYWSFVRDHREFFERVPRSKVMTRTLDRLADDRKKRVFALADAFIEKVTR